MSLDQATLARLGGIKVSTDEHQAEAPPIVVDSAPAPTPEVLAAPPKSSEDSDIKIFRAFPAGSRFQFSQALGYKEIWFSHGWYETSDPQEIKELEAVANKPGSIIFTDAAQDRILAAVNAAKKHFQGQGLSADAAAILEQAIRVGEHQTVQQTSQLGVPNLSVPALDDPEAALRAAIRSQAGAGSQ